MTRFRIDPARSRVWIQARSSLHPIQAETSSVEGFLEADVQDGGRIGAEVVPRGELRVRVAELTSGNLLYDREMRRRVDARRHPTITGELTLIRRMDGRRYLVGGDITLRGVTRRYEDEMELALDDRTVRIRGHRTFDVRDFGIEPPSILALRVHPDVEVRVDLVATAE